MLMKNDSITQAFPLSMACERERVKIVSVTGGKNLIKRLIAMGLIEETELQVLQRQRGHGIIVICGHTRLALGIGITSKIMVVPTDR